MLADPALTIELVAAEPEVASPVAIAWDEDGRLFVAEMIDYPTAPTVGPDPAAGGPRRRRPLRARDRLRRRAAVPERRPALLRRRARDRRAEHLVLPGPRRRRPRRRASRRADRLRRGEHAAPRQRPDVGPGQLDLRRQRPERRRGSRRRPTRPAKAVSIRRRDLRFAFCREFGPDARAPRRSSEVEAIAGFSQFGLPHDDWGNRFPSWNTIPIRHVVLEQHALDRNPYLAETSSVASILDLADGGRIFGISPPQARFNRESVAFFNASCGPMIERGGLLAGRLSRQRLRLRAADQPGASPRARTVRRDLRRPPGRAGPRVPRLDRPGLPAGQPGDRAGRGTLRRRHVPRAGRASPVRARAGARDRSTSAAGTTAGGSGGSGRSPRPRSTGPSAEPAARPTSGRSSRCSGIATPGGAPRRSGCWSSEARSRSEPEPGAVESASAP